MWLCNHFNDADSVDQVNKVQQFLVDHMDVIHYAYPVVAKYYLQKRGLPISTFTRTHTEVFTADVKNKVDCLFNEYQVLKKELERQLSLK